MIKLPVQSSTVLFEACSNSIKRLVKVFKRDHIKLVFHYMLVQFEDLLISRLNSIKNLRTTVEKVSLLAVSGKGRGLKRDRMTARCIVGR